MECFNVTCDLYKESLEDNCMLKAWAVKVCKKHKPLKAQTEPVAEVPCNDVLSLPADLLRLLIDDLNFGIVDPAKDKATIRNSTRNAILDWSYKIEAAR